MMIKKVLILILLFFPLVSGLEIYTDTEFIKGSTHRIIVESPIDINVTVMVKDNENNIIDKITDFEKKDNLYYYDYKVPVNLKYNVIRLKVFAESSTNILEIEHEVYIKDLTFFQKILNFFRTHLPFIPQF